MSFHKATKKQAKARIAIMGPAGSGKTFTGLQLLSLLAPPPAKIGALDTERGSASKYSHKFSFEVDDDFPDFGLRTYAAKLQEAKKAGFGGLLIDSLSHAWSGKGGALEQVDRMGGNKFANGWKTVTPLQNQLIDEILTFPGHVVVTMRSKIEYVMETTADGKSVPKRAGTKPIQRDDVEYEFDVVIDLQQGGTLKVLKTRCESLTEFVGGWDSVPRIVEELKKWLSDGVLAPEQITEKVKQAVGFEPVVVPK